MNAIPQKTLEAEAPSSDPRRDAGAVIPSQSGPPADRDALQSLLAFASLRQMAREGRRLREARGAYDDVALNDVLDLVARRAMQITRADGAAIALADRDGVVCQASAGRMAPDAGIQLSPNSGFSGACLTTGMVVRCDDSDLDPRVNPVTCRQLGSRSMIAVPLTVKGTVIGIVEVLASTPRHFSDRDTRKLNLLAELVLAALQPEEENRMAEISRRAAKKNGATPAAVVLKSAPEAARTTVQPEAAATKASADRQAEKPKNEVASAPEAEAWPDDFPLLGVVTRDEAWGKPAAQAKSDALLKQIKIRMEVPQTPAEPQVIQEELAGPVAEDPLFRETETDGRGAANRRWLLIPAVASAAIVATAAYLWTHQNVVKPQPASSSVSSAAAVSPKPVEETAGSSADVAESNSEAKSEQTGPSAVTGIRHWSAADSTTIAIDLEHQVQYEAHRLSNPSRIYFDLHDTKLDPKLAKTLAVDEGFVSKVRAAEAAPGVTRIVLETKEGSDFNVSMEPNPYRLLIEVHASNAKPQTRTKVELFAPSAPTENAPTAAEKLAPANIPVETKAVAPVVPRKTIILDAGHGGWDIGTVGRKGLLEKDLTLDLVARLGNLLQKNAGYNVVYTRSNDTYVALEKRTEVANMAHGELFVSLHANYSDFINARGVETYYTNTFASAHARTQDGEEAANLKDVNWAGVDIREKVNASRKLAASVQHSLFDTLASKGGVPNRGVKEASYVVLTGTTMPAILTEVSFVSSPEDEVNLQNPSYRQSIAEAIYRGIAKYEDASRQVLLAQKPKLSVVSQRAH